MDFNSIFGGQNQENSIKDCVKKHVFFLLGFFSAFLQFLGILARFWEALDLPKIEKNRENSIFWRGSFEGGFWEGPGRVLVRFWEDFGRVLDRFWKDFVMIFFGF